MKTDFYCESMPYEHFIRNAYGHGYEKAQRNGGDQSYMQNLMRADRGDKNVAHLGSYDKQLAPVRKYMHKAIDAYLKQRLTKADREVFLSLKADLEHAYSIADLMAIINNGLEVVQRTAADALFYDSQKSNSNYSL